MLLEASRNVTFEYYVCHKCMHIVRGCMTLWGISKFSQASYLVKWVSVCSHCVVHTCMFVASCTAGVQSEVFKVTLQIMDLLFWQSWLFHWRYVNLIQMSEQMNSLMTYWGHSNIIHCSSSECGRSLETRPSENWKEGLGDRLGQKCTVHPECRCTSDWFMIACLQVFIRNTSRYR